MVQILFAVGASSLGAVDDVKKDIWFNQQGGLEFCFKKIKAWRNVQQESTGRRLTFRWQGWDAVPKGANKRRQVHFRNQAFAVIHFALEVRVEEQGLMKQW